MRKIDEICLPDSCLGKADNNEWLFVLLSRDEEAPETIRYWVKRRVESGKNKPTDKKMLSALRVADAMAIQFAERKHEKRLIFAMAAGNIEPEEFGTLLAQACAPVALDELIDERRTSARVAILALPEGKEILEFEDHARK